MEQPTITEYLAPSTPAPGPPPPSTPTPQRRRTWLAPHLLCCCKRPDRHEHESDDAPADIERVDAELRRGDDEHAAEAAPFAYRTGAIRHDSATAERAWEANGQVDAYTGITRTEAMAIKARRAEAGFQSPAILNTDHVVELELIMRALECGVHRSGETGAVAEVLAKGPLQDMANAPSNLNVTDAFMNVAVKEHIAADFLRDAYVRGPPGGAHAVAIDEGAAGGTYADRLLARFGSGGKGGLLLTRHGKLDKRYLGGYRLLGDAPGAELGRRGVEPEKSQSWRRKITAAVSQSATALRTDVRRARGALDGYEGCTPGNEEAHEHAWDCFTDAYADVVRVLDLG